MGKRWVPLESNPNVLNEYGRKLGADLSHLAFCDVWGLDEELLAMVPRPVAAVLLLFPITEATEAARKQEQQEMEAAGGAGQPAGSPPFYMKQTIGNACGTIGLLHALANNRHAVAIADGSFLQQFLAATEGMGPAERGAYLEAPPQGAPDIDSIHAAAAQQGDSAVPSADEEVDLHFVAFVCHEGTLYELDGRKSGPIPHGPCSPDRLLQESARVVKANFIERANSIQFNIIALAAAEQDA